MRVESQLIDRVKANFYIPQALQVIRKYYRLSQEELGTKAGLKEGAISNAENQISLLSFEDIFQIENALGLADSVIYSLSDFFCYVSRWSYPS